MICKIVLIFYKDINKFLRTDVLLCSCAFVLVIYFHVILNLTNVYENVPPPPSVGLNINSFTLVLILM